MLAKRLKLLRSNKGLTQEQLAKELNTSKSSVAMWEIGQRDPDSDTIILIADFFDVSTDYLLGKSDDPKLPSHKKEEPEPEEEPNVKWGEFGVSFGSGIHMNDLTDEDKEEMIELFKAGLKLRAERNKRKEEEQRKKGDDRK